MRIQGIDEREEQRKFTRLIQVLDRVEMAYFKAQMERDKK